MLNAINVPTSSTVDMVRIALRFRGTNEKAEEMFDAVAMHMKAKFPDTEVRRQETANGRYREKIIIPAGESSITMGYGLNIGGKCHYETGFVEFNPSKTCPTDDLEHLYYLLTHAQRLLMETKRWDYAVDVPIERTRLALLKDGRTYQCIESGSSTEYLGKQNKGGFVKLYDKQEEIRHHGGKQDSPLSRVEVTIEESGPMTAGQDDQDIISRVWPKIVCIPDDVTGMNSGTPMLIMLAWSHGVEPEITLRYSSKNTRAKYRRAIMEKCGLPPPDDFGDCRRNALAWANNYGGLARR